MVFILQNPFDPTVATRQLALKFNKHVAREHNRLPEWDGIRMSAHIYADK